MIGLALLCGISLRETCAIPPFGCMTENHSDILPKADLFSILRGFFFYQDFLRDCGSGTKRDSGSLLFSKGLKEVQSLLQGREALKQSYERTAQSQIATERQVEKLRQDRIHTERAQISLAEAEYKYLRLLDEEFDDYTDAASDAPIDEDAELQDWLSQIEENLKAYTPLEPNPPMFRIQSLQETSAGIEIEIENLGDPIDALISVADSRSTIIGTPYHISLEDWDYPRRVSFKLLTHDDKINLLVDTGSKVYKIPLFLRERVADPRIMAFPLEQTAKIGESAEYTLVIEGDGNDRGRYPISISNLPDGIAWQIAKIVPAATPDSQPRSIQIRNVQFSGAFNRYELALQLTLERDLPRVLIGKPISFSLGIGVIRETLRITPMGIGELTLDVPAVVQIRLGEEKQIMVDLRNSGTELVRGVAIRSAGAPYGVAVQAEGDLTLAAGEQRALPVVISVAADASVGQGTSDW